MNDKSMELYFKATFKVVPLALSPTMSFCKEIYFFQLCPLEERELSSGDQLI